MAGNVSKMLAVNAQNGKDGDYITRWYTEGDNLYLELNDNRTINLGNVKGPGATIRIGEVVLVDSDKPLKVTNSGTETDAVLNFEIPRGKDGDVTDKYVSMYNSVLEIGRAHV